jgi:hypothetical protein
MPRLQDEAAGTAFAVLPDFLLLEDAEGLAGEVGAVDIGRVQAFPPSAIGVPTHRNE